MKRFCWLLLLAALTLCMGAAYAREAGATYCEQCGDDISLYLKHAVPQGSGAHVWVCEHGVAYPGSLTDCHATCTAETVCADCGQPYTGFNIWHNTTEVWEYDGTSHWKTCADCQQRDRYEEHFARCNNSGVCSICGQPCTGEVLHASSETRQYNDKECWFVCPLCQTEFDHQEHVADCRTPGLCLNCGQSVTVFGLTHAEIGWEHDESRHWEACVYCGEIMSEPGKHHADCNDTTVCAECGAPYNGTDVWHTGGKTEYNEKYHWDVCPSCGKKDMLVPHRADCQNKGVCIMCGAPYTGDLLSHHFDDTWQSDENYHWLVCTACGEKDDICEHFAWCDTPDVCVECGRSVPGLRSSHSESSDDEKGYNAEKHWDICSRCGSPYGEGSHWAYCWKPGVCGYCGAPYNGDAVEHFSQNDNDEYFDGGPRQHYFECFDCKQLVYKNHYYDENGICYACGHDLMDHTHEYEVTAETANGCETDGSTTYTCTICGDSYTETSPATGHNWEQTTTTATCTQDGVTTYICANCGSQYQEAQEKLGHAEWNFDSKTDPTCTTDGEERFVCSRCGYVHHRPITATGHSYGAYAPQNDGTHAASCRNCGTLKSEPCTYNEAGVCTVCGAAKPAAEATAAPVVVPAEEAATVVEIVKEVQEVVAQAQEAVAQAQEAVAQALSAPENAAAQQALLDTIVVTTETLENETVLKVSDQTALLPEDSGILRLFTAELNQQEQTVTPEGLVQIRLAWEDELDIVLYRLTEDGELVEVIFEYDAENKVLVFDTDVMGTFVIVPKA